MNTLFFGRLLIELAEIGSTNNYTSEYLRQNVIPEGAVVIAHNQTAGKGQRGNEWVSEKGKNLTFSVFVQPTFVSPNNAYSLNKWVSVSLAEVLDKLGFESKIKWPNDIYIKDKKVTGILIENSVSKAITHSIVGIGLNVNQTEFGNLNLATSLKVEAGREFNKDSVFEMLMEKLEANYLKLKSAISSFDKLYETYLYRWGVEAKYKDVGGEFLGTIENVNEQGKLVVKRGDEIVSYDIKEVEFL